MVLHNPAVLENDRAVGVGHQTAIMAYYHNDVAVLLREVAKNANDLSSRSGLTWELLDQQVLAGEDYYLIVKR